MQYVRNIAIVAALALGVTIFGCDNSSSSNSNSAVGDAGGKTKAAGDALGGLASKASDSVNQAVSSFKTQYADQIKEYQGKVDQLKQQALALNDAKLNQLIATAETKIKEALSKLDSVKPDSKELDAIKADVSKLIADLKSSYEQALARVKELKP